MVLEGVGWDPVGPLQENGFSIDAEVKAQSWRADNRVLDEFDGAEIHLGEIVKLRSCSQNTHSQGKSLTQASVSWRAASLTLDSVSNTKTPS